MSTEYYTLERFELNCPDMAIFPHLHQPLPAATKRQILQQHRLGDSVEALAQQFCQTRTSIYRVIKETLAARIMELPLSSIGNEHFARLHSDKKDARSWGRCRNAICRRRSRECPVACPRISPACTRCPC